MDTIAIDKATAHRPLPERMPTLETAMTAIPDLPPSGREARFAPGFGQRFIVTVDTEEEFD